MVNASRAREENGEMGMIGNKDDAKLGREKRLLRKFNTPEMTLTFACARRKVK